MRFICAPIDLHSPNLRRRCIHINASINRFTSGLTYFSRTQGSKCKKSDFGSTRVAEIITAAHGGFESFRQRPTNDIIG